MRIQLPYTAIVETHDDVSKDKLNDVLVRALEASRRGPSYLELHDTTSQRFLFFRDGQIYAAGALTRDQFTNTSIREFIVAAGSMNFPQLVYYQLDNTILHSTLILFQKKAGLQVQTSLVDLDELLDRVEAEGKSCIVSASRENFLAALRYEKGAATALCHEETLSRPREATFREEFLVRIYTITTEQPVLIGVYEDLLVSYAPDAKTIPAEYQGRVEDLYLSKPPMVSLCFKDKEIDHWVFDKPQFKIGRTPDNDITIDNLAVSRLHAVLEEEKGSYYVRDCDSLNGTVVNGRKVGRARLRDGDRISIGKHTIVFTLQGGQAVLGDETIQGFDQTMVINTSKSAPVPNADAAPAAPPPAPRDRPPRIIVRTDYGDKVIEIKEAPLTIGKDTDNDIAIDGAFVGRRHAEIVRDGDRIVIRRVGGFRRLTVGGRSVKETELKNNDEIKIAREEFIFQE